MSGTGIALLCQDPEPKLERVKVVIIEMIREIPRQI
jgi:hypothetical protein